MNRNRQHLRRGQVLIVMALSMTVLFGLTGLTYDVGMIYRDRDILNASTSGGGISGSRSHGPGRGDLNQHEYSRYDV